MALACTGSQCNFRSNGDRVGVADSAYVGCCSSGGAGSGRCRYAAVSKEKDGLFPDLRRCCSEPCSQYHSGRKYCIFRSIRSDHAADYLAAD
mgnify:CR=1 FL=1